MGRILAVDFGNRRIGVAVSDPLQIIATPLETLTITSLKDGVSRLAALCGEIGPEAVIMGYPLGTSGNKTEQTIIVDEVIEALSARTDIPIIKWDERYTSVEAEQILRQQGIKTRDNKGIIDQLAARIMLQEFLDSRSKS
ncbi:MAG: Holliday junction resolvase RuvX [Candidatus Marinimicrobia bacterium]|nr:Holliday junction resolvase RuvX [Candidatus Neomarinimicrobiota bacterium]